MQGLSNFIFNQLPGVIGFKNKASVYTHGNRQLAQLMGYQDVNDMIGTTDHDIRSDIARLAEDFIQQDRDVLQQGEQQHLDIGRHANGDWRLHFSTKKPYLNAAGELLGLVFHCVALHPATLKMLHPFLEKHKPVFYAIDKQCEDIHLTARESECLFYLLRGKTAKATALLLAISPKTVEYHLEQLKRKFHCANKSMLIEKAMALGFLCSIPTTFFHQSMLN